jgi:hypothetical protein
MHLLFPVPHFPLRPFGVFLRQLDVLASTRLKDGNMQVMLVATDQDEKETFAYIIRREGLAIASSSDLQRVLKNWTDHPADILVVALGKNFDLVEDDVV